MSNARMTQVRMTRDDAEATIAREIAEGGINERALGSDAKLSSEAEALALVAELGDGLSRASQEYKDYLAGYLINNHRDAGFAEIKQALINDLANYAYYLDSGETDGYQADQDVWARAGAFDGDEDNTSEAFRASTEAGEEVPAGNNGLVGDNPIRRISEEEAEAVIDEHIDDASAADLLGSDGELNTATEAEDIVNLLGLSEDQSEYRQYLIDYLMNLNESGWTLDLATVKHVLASDLKNYGSYVDANGNRNYDAEEAWFRAGAMDGGDDDGNTEDLRQNTQEGERISSERATRGEEIEA